MSRGYCWDFEQLLEDNLYLQRKRISINYKIFILILSSAYQVLPLSRVFCSLFSRSITHSLDQGLSLSHESLLSRNEATLRTVP